MDKIPVNQLIVYKSLKNIFKHPRIHQTYDGVKKNQDIQSDHRPGAFPPATKPWERKPEMNQSLENPTNGGKKSMCMYRHMYLNV